MSAVGVFRDRAEAGRELGNRLNQLSLVRPVVLGIPRGGVVTAAAIAEVLGAELDIVLSRKLRAPSQPELAIGALGEDGSVYHDRATQEMVSASSADLSREIAHQLEEIARRKAMFRAVRPAAELKGRSVIVTDDGIATGSTMLAALQTVRLQKPLELIVAVPVAPPDRLELIRLHCDRLICLEAPREFFSVGQFYLSFDQVSDEEACELLRKHWAATHSQASRGMLPAAKTIQEPEQLR
jgi:putative phosphoribosyl transferase